MVTNPDPEATVIVDLDYTNGTSWRYDATAGELAPGESLEGSVTVPVELVRTGETVVFVAEVSYPGGMSFQSISNQVVLPDCTPAQV